MGSSKYNAEIDDGKYLFPATLTETEIPSDSITRIIHGQERHLLFKDSDGYHAAIIHETDANVITPADLYDCLEDKHSPLLFCNKEHPGKKWAITGLFVTIGFMLFLLFVMGVASLGKTPLTTSILNFAMGVI
jgi:hypothetical protein